MSPTLPSDVVFHILTGLPVRTLLRLRCVSKLWLSMIDGHDFATAHLSRSSEVPRPMLLSSPTSKPTSGLSFRQDGAFLIARIGFKVNAFHGSCNGLLCFSDPDGVVLVNPARAQVLRLPPEPPRFPAAGRRKYGLGLDPKTNTYKVVSFSVSGLARDSRVWALVGPVMMPSWREVDSGSVGPTLGRPVYADGAIHWLTHDSGSPGIVSFDVGSERFGPTRCPGFLVGHLVDLRGVLGIVDCSSDAHIEIWGLKGERGWVREWRIQISAPEEVGDNGNTEVVGFWGGGEVLIRYMESFLSYNVGDGEMKYRHIPWLEDDVEVYSHVCSLVSLVPLQVYGMWGRQKSLK